MNQQTNEKTAYYYIFKTNMPDFKYTETRTNKIGRNKNKTHTHTHTLETRLSQPIDGRLRRPRGLPTRPVRQLVEHILPAMNVRHSSTSTSSTATIGAEVKLARQDPEGAALVFLVETAEHDDAIPPGQALVARVDRAVSVLVEVRPTGVPGIIGRRVDTRGGGVGGSLY